MNSFQKINKICSETTTTSALAIKDWCLATRRTRLKNACRWRSRLRTIWTAKWPSCERRILPASGCAQIRRRRSRASTSSAMARSSPRASTQSSFLSSTLKRSHLKSNELSSNQRYNFEIVKVAIFVRSSTRSFQRIWSTKTRFTIFNLPADSSLEVHKETPASQAEKSLSTLTEDGELMAAAPSPARTTPRVSLSGDFKRFVNRFDNKISKE